MRIAILLILTLSMQTAVGADLSPYVNPCEASFKAEAQFVEDGLVAVREKWRAKVRIAFDAKKLNEPRRAAAELAFASIVAKMSDDFSKTLSLGGIFRTMSMMPVVPSDICKDPKQLRSLSEQTISQYEDLLEKLLPMIETVAQVAAREG
jgi:hypothetical protein